MIHRDDIDPDLGGELPDNPYAPLVLDVEEYMFDLEDWDISDTRKHEILAALWHIMGVLVDIGFGVDTVQYLLPDIFEKASRDSVKLLEVEKARNFDHSSRPKQKGGKHD